MAPKLPPPGSSSSDSSEASSDEEQEEQVSQLIPPPPQRKHLPPAPAPATAATTAEEDTDEEDDEEDRESEGDKTRFPPKPAPPVAAAKPALSSKQTGGFPKGGQPSTETPKKKSQEAEAAARGDAAAAAPSAHGSGPATKKGKKRGAQKGQDRPGTIPPSRIRRGSAATKPVVTSGELSDGKAGVLCPSIREAIRLLAVENKINLMEGQLCKVLEQVEPAEAQVLEEQWNRHFIAGVKYSAERAKLKAELLNSIV